MWRRRLPFASLVCQSLTIDGFDVADDGDRSIDPADEPAWSWRYRRVRRRRP